jgi:hypothetical protein
MNGNFEQKATKRTEVPDRAQSRSSSSLPFVNSVRRDSNGNGLPDYWMVEHGLDPDIPLNDLASDDLHGPNGDPDGDGLTNLQEYLAGSSPVRPNSQNLASGSINYKRLAPASSLAATGKAYDVYHRPDVNSQWRRVSSGIPGQKAFTFVNPNPSAEGDYIFLDAADYDGDGLSDGYEKWFTYTDSQGLQKRTNPLLLTSLGGIGDDRKDGWKVAYGLNPMNNTGIGAPSYRVVVDQEEDEYTSLEKHDLYYDAPANFDAQYDPLNLTGSTSVRPVVTISQSASGFNLAVFTIHRDVGSGSAANVLTVNFTVGGDLVYKRDYALTVGSGVTLNDQAPPFSVTIPVNQSSVDLTIVVTPGAVPASHLAVMLVPFGSVQ